MMGCGSTGVAALELDRKFVGFELDPQYFKAASDRLGFFVVIMYPHHPI